MNREPAAVALAAPARPVDAYLSPRRGPTVGPAAAVGAAAVGALLVAGLWWSSASPPTTGAEALVEVGRLLGLAAGYGVILLTLLAARIPALDARIGTERLLSWHASLGRYVVVTAVAHAVAIVAGYAGRDGTGLWSTALDLTTGSVDLLAATAAAAVMVTVGVVSVRAARRRLPYEVWHAIHLAMYAAIALALFHQVIQGAQFVDAPRARALWLVLSIGAVVLVLVNRLVRPWVVNARHRFVVGEVRWETPETFSMTIGGRDLARLRADAGQLVRVHAAARGLRFASNPYSLSAAPRASGLRITVQTVGRQSQALSRLAPGTRLWLEGPMGALTLPHRSADADRRPVLLVGSGAGVAPLRALAEAALVRRPGAPVVMVYRVPKADGAVLARELADLAAWSSGRLTVHLRAGSRTAPGNTITPALLVEVAPWVAQADVLVCGGASLARDTIDAARTVGVPAARIKTEAFGW